MASNKDNYPLSLAKDSDSTGTITYANEVIAIIAGVAANEVEGIAGMCSGGGFADAFMRSRNIKKGVKVEIGAEEASVDLYVIVEYGTPIQIAALNVQESVRKAIETMTGLHVVRVDVHVNGVSFEKEKLEEEAGLENAKLSDVKTPALEEKPAAKPETKAAAKPEPPQKEPAKPATKLKRRKPKTVKTPVEKKAEAPAEPAKDQEQKPEA